VAKAKVWNGSAWIDKTPGAKYWNGSAWVSNKPIKFWDGAQWVTVSSSTSYPTIFGTPTTASSTNGGTLNPGFPGGYTWQANDFGLFIGISNSATTPTLPSGWTAIDGFAFGSSYIYGAYRVLQSGDSAPTFTTGTGLKIVAGLTIFRNAVLDGTPGFTRESVNQAAHPAPAITTTGVNELVVYMFGEKSSTNTGWTDPSGTTRLLQQLTTGSGAVSCLMAYKQVAAATSVGATTASVNGSTSAQATGFTIALKGVA